VVCLKGKGANHAVNSSSWIGKTIWEGLVCSIKASQNEDKAIPGRKRTFGEGKPMPRGGKKMKTKAMRWLPLPMALVALMLFTAPAFSGDLEPTAPPGPTMHTLDEIHDKIEALQSSCPKPYVYVGLSSSGESGSRGFLVLNEACQQDFPDSRMCTTEEIINTTNFPSYPMGFSQRGYARSIVISASTGFIDVATSISLLDASSVNCGGWSSSGSQALVLREFHSVSTDITEFELAGCDEGFKVACCAPAP
jgi:hypothetical protein